MADANTTQGVILSAETHRNTRQMLAVLSANLELISNDGFERFQSLEEGNQVFFVEGCAKLASDAASLICDCEDCEYELRPS
jgi:hypothetical protein